MICYILTEEETVTEKAKMNSWKQQTINKVSFLSLSRALSRVIKVTLAFFVVSIHIDDVLDFHVCHIHDDDKKEEEEMD